MYNRYIPQPDGSYRKDKLPDQSRHQPRQHPVPPPPPKQEEPCREPEKNEPTCSVPKPEQQKYNHSPQGSSITGFLQRLLPKDFDTGDLIVVLLLLLMAGDCKEDQNTALLTLALYFFM